MPDPHVLSGDTISDAAPLQVTEGTGNPAHYLSGDLIDDDHPLQVVQVETLQTVPDVLDLTDQGSTPSAPAAGHTVVYSESGRLYQRAHGGAAIELTNSGDLGDLPTDDQKAALDANTSLSGTNPVASMADVGGGGLPAGLEAVTVNGYPGFGVKQDGAVRAAITFDANGIVFTLLDAAGSIEGDLFFVWNTDHYIVGSDSQGIGGHSFLWNSQLGSLDVESILVSGKSLCAANQPAIDPEATAADAAFNALRTAMIASGLMAADPA